MCSRETSKLHLTRRVLLRAASATMLSGVAAPALVGGAKAQNVAINVASYGGVLNDYMTTLFAQPFEEEAGIRVNFGANASLTLAELQITSGSAAQWDIVVLTGAEYVTALNKNLLEPYDYKIVDATYAPPEYRGSHGIKITNYLFGIAYDQRKLSDEQAPRTWAEFWDTSRYPGKRSLNSNVSDGSLLEAALLADGVALNKLYPLDVDRALRSLDRLGRKNITWHSTNQEPIQQLTSGAVALATVFGGRVVLANRGGAQLGFRAEGSAVSGNLYCVIRTSARKREAFQFINYVLNKTTADAKYMELTKYAIPNTRALALVSPETLSLLPTAPELKDKVFIKDDVWWAANLAQVTTRFKEWQLAG